MVTDSLKVYKQNTSQGCLAVCLMLLGDQEITVKREIDLTIGGLKYRESWALGIVDSFVKRFKRKIIIYANNKYFYKKLKNFGSEVDLVHRKIDRELIIKQTRSFILYIDSKIVGTYVHSPHFIICEKKDDQFYILDSIKGKKIKSNIVSVLKGVYLLKNYLKFCPLLITIDVVKM